jgi:putative FmdB family regulatory protein
MCFGYNEGDTKGVLVSGVSRPNVLCLLFFVVIPMDFVVLLADPTRTKAGECIMPIYVYHCDHCGQTFERRQSISAAPLADCPECDGHVYRVMQPVGIVFKGSGFYVTDNRSSSSTALPGERKSGTKKAANVSQPGQ